jgi:phospholipid-binding lipoprotein MlaA
MKLDRPRAAFAALAIALSLGALGGCAVIEQHINPRDPLERVNRHTHDFNEGADRIVLRPAATFYRERVPALVRTGVANFFNNLGDGWSAVNSLLQFRLQDFEENLARFHLNTMFGLFGIFDLASELNIERHREDFGQTLGRWGIPAGPYIVLPLLGPSTLRDTVALPVDRKFDFVSHVNPEGVRAVTYTLRAVDRRSNLLRVGNVLEEASLDKYSFIRDAYLQRRRAEVMDFDADREVPPALPDESQDPPAGAAPAAPRQPASAPAR